MDTCQDFETPTLWRVSTPKAHKTHQCTECGRIIEVGELYELVDGLWNCHFSHYLACYHCTDLRTHFSLGCYPYGGLIDEVAREIDMWLAEE